MKTLITTLALILSFFSTTSYATPQELEVATEQCNSYFKVAVVTSEFKDNGSTQNELSIQIIESAMPEADKEIVLWIIDNIYIGVPPVAIFDECYQAAFEMYGSII